MALTNQELLERIAPYLPYNVQLVCDNIYEGFKCELVISNNTNSLKNGMNINECIANDAKLILHSLSDLTKPCLEGGKVPIVELIKYVYNHKYYLVDTSIKNNTCIVRFKPNQFDSTMYFLDVDIDEFGVSYGIEREVDKNEINNDRYLPVNDIIGIMKFLFKNHFDIHNLIGCGHAIDINTLKDE